MSSLCSLHISPASPSLNVRPLFDFFFLLLTVIPDARLLWGVVCSVCGFGGAAMITRAGSQREAGKAFLIWEQQESRGGRDSCASA